MKLLDQNPILVRKEIITLGKLTLQDSQVIRQCKTPENQLGFAYQLAFVRTRNYLPNPTLPFLKLNLSKSMTYILKKRLGSLQLNKLFFQCAQVVNSCLTIYRSQLALELPLRFF